MNCVDSGNYAPSLQVVVTEKKERLLIVLFSSFDVNEINDLILKGNQSKIMQINVKDMDDKFSFQCLLNLILKNKSKFWLIRKCRETLVLHSKSLKVIMTLLHLPSAGYLYAIRNEYISTFDADSQ